MDTPTREGGALADPEVRARFKARLEAMLADMDQRRRHLKEWGLGGGSQEAAAELSSYDQHTADAGTEMFTRSQDFGLMEEAGTAQEEIRAALARLEEGTYGRCQRCGQPIPYGRLEALPLARFCTACAREEEGRRPGARARGGWRSPAFERMPSGSPYLEEEGRQGAWDALGDYPSSNTPQDEPTRATRPREP